MNPLIRQKLIYEARVNKIKDGFHTKKILIMICTLAILLITLHNK